jgi:hypothetical protein
MSDFDWTDFLRIWSRVALAHEAVPDNVSQEAIAAQWLGRPRATEAELTQAEDRLKVRLPPSYRAFLCVTNGWPQAGGLLNDLRSVKEIDWFAIENQEWIDAYVRPAVNAQPVTDDAYTVYGDKQLSSAFRLEYLQTALQISTDTNATDTIYLLNPQIVTSRGEWEAWMFADWFPGAVRYRSFLEMMQAQFEQHISEHQR